MIARARGLCILWLLGLGLCLAQSTPAQEPEVTFQSNVNLVSLSVHVTDRHQKPAPDLSKADFTITENGRPQQIRVFTHTSPPLSLGIVLDCSLSMRRSLEAALTNTFLRSLTQDLHFETEFLSLHSIRRCGPSPASRKSRKT